MKNFSYFLIALMMASYSMESTAQTISGQIGGYDYVDLGLPSGTMWATYNVGATKPTELGDYFAWGETEPKKDYEWTSYKWCTVYENGNYDQFTKYVINSGYGAIDNKTVLEPDDDAAYANWGSGWRMPTVEEQKELIAGCTWEDKREWQKGTSKTNGAIIVLPIKNFGIYHSSSLSEDVTYKSAGILIINSIQTSTIQRCRDANVRAVVDVNGVDHGTISFYTKDSVLIEKQLVMLGRSAKKVEYPFVEGYEFVGWSDSSFTNVTKDLDVYAQYRVIVDLLPTVNGSINGYDYVDLGLPSGRLWATYNVGATKPTEYGDYFRWGQTWPCSNSNKHYEVDPYATGLGASNDAATVNLGHGWRTPTSDEQKELLNGCVWKWTDNFYGSGIKGKMGISKTNGNLIFLPAAGDKVDSDCFHAGEFGYYWSSTPDPELDDPYGAYDMGFSKWSEFTNSYDRAWGRTVRAVVVGNPTRCPNKIIQNLQVYTRERTVFVSNAQANTDIMVFLMNGVAVATATTDSNGNAEITLSSSEKEYVVTVGDQSAKVVLR
ncbi:MAG: hypothetical protein J5554_03625 [Paludibacteraceae bacterium]|nr:hypothetical protein [Paludibacteraceae bacterium]